jgi:hypothetical protein
MHFFYKKKKLIFILIIFLGVLGIYFLHGSVLKERFNKELWSDHSYKNENTCVRGNMVSDLFENHIRIGDQRRKIEDLLGPSDYKNESAYVLGMCAGIDLEALHLQFDSEDKLIRYQIKKH